MKRIIIIGAGIGGLIAANLLAKKGYQVTLCESHSAPGGYTAGFKKKGFYFESGTLAFEASSSVFKAMKQLGIYDKVTFIKKTAQRWINQDFDAIIKNYAQLKEVLYNSYPTYKEQLKAYFTCLDPIYKIMRMFIKKPMRHLANPVSRIIDNIGMLLKIKKIITVFKTYARLNICEMAERFFPIGSQPFNLLAGLGYCKMGFITLAGMMAMFEDYWTVKQGMQTWADVLADNFKKSGGELKLNSYVDKIITKNKQVTGVMCNNKLWKTDIVISACDYKKTLLKLLDNTELVPIQLRQKITQAPVSEPFFTVYLGLGISNKKLLQTMKNPSVYFLNTNEYADFDNSNDETIFEKSPLMLFSSSLINPDLAPEGKSSLMIQSMCPVGWMNNWGGGDKSVYKKLKQKVKTTLIKRSQTIIPGLRDYIEYEDAATPRTYERFTHNSFGASSAWSWNPHKSFYENPRSDNTITPIENLYICSCWTNQIGGVPGAFNGAYQTFKNIRKKNKN